MGAAPNGAAPARVNSFTTLQIPPGGCFLSQSHALPQGAASARSHWPDIRVDIREHQTWHSLKLPGVQGEATPLLRDEDRRIQNHDQSGDLNGGRLRRLSSTSRAKLSASSGDNRGRRAHERVASSRPFLARCCEEIGRTSTSSPSRRWASDGRTMVPWETLPMKVMLHRLAGSRLETGRISVSRSAGVSAAPFASPRFNFVLSS